MHALPPATTVGQGLLIQPLGPSPHTTFTVPHFEPSSFLRAISEHRPSHVVLVPAMAIVLVSASVRDEFDVSSVRQVRTTSAPIHPATLEQLSRMFTNARVRNVYSTTECWPRRMATTYELSGPRALTFREATEQIARASGRQVRYTDLTPDEYVAAMVAQGFSAADAGYLLEMFALMRRGLFGEPTDDVRQVLGRAPRTLNPMWTGCGGRDPGPGRDGQDRSPGGDPVGAARRPGPPGVPAQFHPLRLERPRDLGTGAGRGARGLPGGLAGVRRGGDPGRVQRAGGLGGCLASGAAVLKGRGSLRWTDVAGRRTRGAGSRHCVDDPAANVVHAELQRGTVPARPGPRRHADP